MRSSSAIITPQIAQEIDSAVRVGRKLRKVPRSATREHQREVGALKSVVTGLFEYADVHRMQVSFKKCTPTCDDDDDEIGVPEHEGKTKQYYEVTVEMKRIDDQSHGGRLLSGAGLASACEKDVQAKLDSYQARLPQTVLKYSRAEGEYDANRQAYFLHFELVALQHDAEPEPKQKAKKRKINGEANNESMPSVEECVKFYTQRSDTWSLFGYDVKSWFRVPQTNRNSRLSFGNKSR